MTFVLHLPLVEGRKERGDWSGVAGEELDRHRRQQMLTEAGEPNGHPFDNDTHLFMRVEP